MINENPERSFIYVTPLLSEVERVRQATDKPFYEPIYKNNGRKLDDFNNLLCDGVNIVTTHSTFVNSTNETIELLRNGNYTLILDEVLDVVSPYNDIINDPTQIIKPKDIKMLLDKKLITVDKYGRVSWIGESYQGGSFTEVERLANRGNLLLVNGTLFLWEFPSEIFNILDEVIVCTYLFNGSFLKYFFDYHGFEYKLAGVDKKDGNYCLTEYTPDISGRIQYKELIDICYDDKLNDYPNSAFTSTWFRKNVEKKKNAPESKRLRNNLYNYFHNKKNAAVSDIAWTTYKDSKSAVQGPGYTRIRKFTMDEQRLPQRAREQLHNKLSCFISSNARASNDYRERSVLAYLCNMWPQPHIKQFFKLKEIDINDDAFAISCLIQWVWRSRIRDGQPISLYLPSIRMRKLLRDWIAGRTF